MAQIKMIIVGVDEANQYLRKTIQQVQEIVSVNEMLKHNVDMEIQSRHQIAQQLFSCLQMAEELQRFLKGCLTVAEESLIKYRKTEEVLRREMQEILNLDLER